MEALTLDQLIDGVVGLFPSADRQALRCLGKLAVKDIEAERDALKAQLAERDAEIERLLEACHQARIYVEADETAHGRLFGTGNAIRAALKGPAL